MNTSDLQSAPIWNKIRRKQARFAAKTLLVFNSSHKASNALVKFRRIPLVGGLLRAATGYNRVYETLSEANRAVAHFQGRGGHEAPEVHLFLAQKARPSDYPALFHLNTKIPNLKTVFDFGGCVGNLFYCYDKYLSLSPNLEWRVFDLPANLERTRQLAAARHEQRVYATESLEEAEGVDLFLASGSLHYFDVSLAEFIGRLKSKPKYVMVNRTPMTNVNTFVAIQDGYGEPIAAKIYNRKTLIADVIALGYECVDEWDVFELHMAIPLYADKPIQYAGMFFRLKTEIDG